MVLRACHEYTYVIGRRCIVLSLILKGILFSPGHLHHKANRPYTTDQTKKATIFLILLRKGENFWLGHPHNIDEERKNQPYRVVSIICQVRNQQLQSICRSDKIRKSFNQDLKARTERRYA